MGANIAINLELWHVLSIIGALCGALWAFGSVFFKQVIESINDRFEQAEISRKETHMRIDDQFDEVYKRQSGIEETGRRLERDYLIFRAEMPKEYVMKIDMERFRDFIEVRVQEIRTLIIGMETKMNDKADKKD